MPDFDLAIIGGGPAGYVGAIRSSQLGIKTVLIERQTNLGGTCLNAGCIPTKALLHATKLYKKLSGLAEYGITVKNPGIDLKKLHDYKDSVVAKLAKGIDYLMKKNKVTVAHGEAKYVDSNHIKIVSSKSGSERTIEVKNSIIATGSRAGTLPDINIDGKYVINSDHALALQRLPSVMLIVGAGAVGVEFATYFNNLGVKVTVAEFLPDVVPLEDKDISKELEKQFRKAGIEVMTGTKLAGASVKDGKVEVILEGKEKKDTRSFDLVLMCVGRKPVTESLDLENTRVKVDRGFVQFKGAYQTDDPAIYAVGDVIKTPALAHVASYEAVRAVEAIAGMNSEPLNYDRIPNCTFCQPEIASVGLTEQEAVKRGIDVKVAKFPASAMSKAIVTGDTEGFIKVIADKRYNHVLGIHIIHAQASLLVGEAVQIINMEGLVEDISGAIHPHPTLSEIFPEVAHLYAGEAIHL